MEEVSSGLGAQEPLWGGLDRLPRLDGAAAAGYWRWRALAGCDGDDGEEQERGAQRGLPKVSAVGRLVELWQRAPHLPNHPPMTDRVWGHENQVGGPASLRRRRPTLRIGPPESCCTTDKGQAFGAFDLKNLVFKRSNPGM